MNHSGTVTIRDMRLGEEKALYTASKRAFRHSPVEQLAISKPKTALVAEVDGAVAGAVFLKIFGEGASKTGYLDIGYVAREHRGTGVARVLYPAAVQRLRDMGCHHIAALVIDDNAASWKPLQNMGFSAPSLLGLVRRLGLGPALDLWLRTLFCFASGTRLWMSGPAQTPGSGREFASFLLVNMLLFSPGMLAYTGQPGLLAMQLCAYALVLLLGVLLGAVGTVVAGQQWRFGFPRGGALLTLLCGVVRGVFPMVGRWYLKTPAPTAQSRRAMGIQATVEWAGLAALFCLYAVFLPQSRLIYDCISIASPILLFHILPFMPFGAFGGTRVYTWNKVVYGILAVSSAVLLFIVL